MDMLISREEIYKVLLKCLRGTGNLKQTSSHMASGGRMSHSGRNFNCLGQDPKPEGNNTGFKLFYLQSNTL